MREPSAVQEPVIVAASPRMIELRGLARRAAQTDATVLITGESGVGKDLLARALHVDSARARYPFVAVNCAGMAETLLESELFGHTRGSFTGAHRDHVGKLQSADHGTLFLDEVGEMSERMQALLLRFLENRELQPVGSTRAPLIVDVRLVAATNRSLPERVAAGMFREDLLYRLRVIELHVPPLRERRDDIGALIEHFSRADGRRVTFSPEATVALLGYRWPGNVRELQNVIAQASWLADGGTIELRHLPEPVRENRSGALVRTQERRRQVADQLFESLVARECSFWDEVHPLFISRDITRHDLRELLKRGLEATHGNYRALLRLFGLPSSDYHRLHNFLAAHDCKVDYRRFRVGVAGNLTEHATPAH
jgi:transcriptional regulator with PAS, ATPase and Fis domain